MKIFPPARAPSPKGVGPCAQQPRRLLRNALKEVATLARVPDQEREQFRGWMSENVQAAWKWHCRAASKPDRALTKAAQAARTLNEAVCSLSKKQRKRLDKLIAQDMRLYDEQRLFETVALHQTVFLLDYLFSTVSGKSPPLMAGIAQLPRGQGRKKHAVGSPIFDDFVFRLLVCVAEAGGELTLNPNDEKGTLLDALEALRPHLPSGLIRNALPCGTLQKIKTQHAKARRLLAT